MIALVLMPRRTARRYLGQVKYCHGLQLQEGVVLEGELGLVLEIARGRVESVVVEQDTMQSEALAECVQQKIKRWKYPQDVTGTAEYTISFSAVEQ